MSRLRKLAALLLVALWIPATLHCAFELAEIAFLSHDDHDHHHGIPAGTHGGTEDPGHAIEHTPYTATTPSLKVPPPADSLSILLAALAWPASVCIERPLSPASHGPPPEWRVAWQFITRAAPPARAPSLNS